MILALSFIALIINLAIFFFIVAGVLTGIAAVIASLFSLVVSITVFFAIWIGTGH